jgi:DNA polymerase III sliding clamp (beta) subunit (PCNA family)
MILDRHRLSDILDTLKISQGNKVMEVSFYVKFMIDSTSHALYLSTTDFHSYIVIDFGDVSLTTLDDVPAEFLIKFQELSNLIKYSTTTDVEITQDEDGHILVKTNGIFKFALYPDVEQFPTADFEHQPAGEWDAAALLDIWAKVSPVVSKDTTKASYQGVNFDGNWAASDNRRFAIMMSENGEEYSGASMLIPTIFGNVLNRCKGRVVVGPNSGNSMLVVNNPETGMLAAMRLYDAKFVDYKRVFDGRTQYVQLTIPKVDLSGALNRMSCFTDKVFQVGIFTVIFDGDDVTLRCCIRHDTNEGDEDIVVKEFKFEEQLDSSVRQQVLDTGPAEVAKFQYQIKNLAAGIDGTDSKDDVLVSLQEDGKLWIDEGPFHYLLSCIRG